MSERRTFTREFKAEAVRLATQGAESQSIEGIRRAGPRGEDRSGHGAGILEIGERAAVRARFSAPGTGGTGGGAAPRTGGTGGTGGTAPVGTGTESNAMTALTPELLKKIERVLTQHIGPIARVVLKKTAQAPTAEALFERLAEQVAAGPERERLLADLRRLV